MNGSLIVYRMSMMSLRRILLWDMHLKEAASLELAPTFQFPTALNVFDPETCRYIQIPRLPLNNASCVFIMITLLTIKLKPNVILSFIKEKKVSFIPL